MTSRIYRRLASFSVIALMLGALAFTAYAATGPETGSGTETVVPAKNFEPGDSDFIHIISVVQAAGEGDLTVDRVKIQNVATGTKATATEIDKIEVYISSSSSCSSPTLTGQTSDIAAYNGAGVMIELTGFTVSPGTSYMCFKATTKSGQVAGRNFKNKVIRWEGIDQSILWAQNVSFTAANTHTTKNSGFFENSHSSPTAQQSVSSGGSAFVQIIKVRDHESNTKPDANGNPVTVNSVTIDNLGTATLAGDVTNIAVFNCGTTADCSGTPSLMGTISGGSGSFPVTIPLVTANTFSADHQDRYIGIRVTVSSTPGNTFRLRTVLNVTEGTISSSTGNIDVPTGKETIIEVEGFETVADCSAFTTPASVTPGETSKVVQCITLTDNDANGSGPNIKQIQIQQFGTALGNPDISKIEYGTCNNNGSGFSSKGSQSAPFTFPVTIDGTDVTPGDDATVNICVRVDIDANAVVGRTINFTSNLTVAESPDVIQSRAMPAIVTIASGIGCEVLTDENFGPATIASGTVGFDAGNTNGLVQVVKCQDSDGNTQNIAINSLTITNLGTADTSDITRIAVYDCGSDGCADSDIANTQRKGSITPVPGFPVTIPLTGMTVNDDSTKYIGIVVDVSSTLGNTIQFQTTLNVTEASTIDQGPVNDGTASTILAAANRGCEAVTDLNVDAGSLPSGTNAIVQRLVCADADGIADNNPVLITQVNVRNLGTAVGGSGGDVSKIEIVRMDTMAVVGSTTNTANFGTATGVNIPVSVTVPDDGSVELGVRVYVTSTPGRTIQPRTQLRMFEGGVGPFFKSADDGTAETIAAPAACPTIVQGSPAAGQIGVLQAVPNLKYTAADQSRTVRVRVINRSSIPIIVEDISEQIGQLFSVEGVTPILPKTILPNRSVTFFVRTIGPATGETTFPHQPARPYFVVDINCGGPTGSSPAKVKRVELGEVRAEQRGNVLRFYAQGSGIAQMSVQLYDITGRLQLNAQATGTRLTVLAQNQNGQRLANGVYLYVVTVTGYDGKVIRSEVRKLVVKH